MDPEANLKEALALAGMIVRREESEDALRLAELLIALDEWIHKGGFLPARWSQVL